MKFGVLGNSTLAENLAVGFAQAGHTCELAVSLPNALLPNASGGLWSFAAAKDIPYFEFADANSDEFHDILDAIPVDFLVVSWPRMLRQRLISRFAIGVIGTHPTPLPWGRGRHPLHWLIAMGISETKLSFFLIDDGVDTGELIDQEVVVLEPMNTVKDALMKLDHAAQVGAFRVGMRLLENGYLITSQQSTSEGSLWRARTRADVQIDCRMSVDAILRLVRSFTDPFPLSQLMSRIGPLAICKGELLDSDRECWIMHSIGTILKVSHNALDIRVDDGVIRLHTVGEIVGLHAGDCLHPPSFYR
jgi:methionyl-tRNA formyltransferase